MLCGLRRPAPNKRKEEKTKASASTPQQYNKKSVKFDQGLDFLKVWRGKSRKTIRKRRENKENTIK